MAGGHQHMWFSSDNNVPLTSYTLDDCASWTSSAATDAANSWGLVTPGVTISLCTATLPIACCD